MPPAGPTGQRLARCTRHRLLSALRRRVAHSGTQRAAVHSCGATAAAVCTRRPVAEGSASYRRPAVLVFALACLPHARLASRLLPGSLLCCLAQRRFAPSGPLVNRVRVGISCCTHRLLIADKAHMPLPGQALTLSSSSGCWLASVVCLLLPCGRQRGCRAGS